MSSAIERKITAIDKKADMISTDVKYMKETLSDYIKEIKANTNFRISCEAQGNLIKVAVGSGWLVTLIMLIISVYGKIIL